MIHILYAPGGGGKSYYQMRLIWKELRYGRRNISTTLALNMPALQEYADKHGGDAKIDVGARVRLLTVEEAKEFWKYRGPNRWRSSEGCEYDLIVDPGAAGTLFVLDEAGAVGFSATGWVAKYGNTTRGEAATWYLDQQRKFGDDVYASCNGRRPSGIAKPFRDKAHYFIRLKNGYQRQMGIFKARGRFEAEWFQAEPGPNVEPCNNEHWELDTTGLAGCYFTDQGIGVAGGAGADIGKRAKGIPVLWAFPLAIAAASLVFVIPWALSRGWSKTVKPVGATVQTAVDGKRGADAGVARVKRMTEEVRGVVARGPDLLVFCAGEWRRVASVVGDRVTLDGGYEVLLQDVQRGATPRPEPENSVRAEPFDGVGGVLGGAARLVAGSGDRAK